MLSLAGVASAQLPAKPVNLYDSAHFYYQKKDFKKAFYFYDTYYRDTTHGQSNYDTYYAAVAACQAGFPKEAAFYLMRSAAIGYDYPAYDTFANDPLNACLRTLPEWQRFIVPFRIKADSAAAALKAIGDILSDTTIRVNRTLLSDTGYWWRYADQHNARQLLQAIKDFSAYPLPKQNGHWTVYSQPVNDTLSAPFLCWIPANYHPAHAAPLYVFLHGGVSGPKNFGLPAYQPSQQQDLLKKAMEQGAFIIFPFAKKTFNWLRHQQAFETILSEIARVKSLYHIDDNSVYIGGHSDGGRGAFWFAINRATPFAAFYGICYYPSVYTGNTSLRNLHNGAPFYGISATNDALFPPSLVFSVIQYDQKAGGNWHPFEIMGNHGLPYAAPEKVQFLFDSLLTRKRNPKPNHLVWETDNTVNGRYDWVSINKLDTARDPADWHTPLLPVISGKDGKSAPAHFLPHRSGAVSADFHDNVFTILTSRVGNLTVYLLDGMIDPDKPIRIYINGKLRFQGKIKPDKQVILSEFLQTMDRAALPLNRLTFDVGY